MNQTLIITLTAAALSGLSVVAYKHPEGYRRMFVFVLPLLGTIGLVVLAWQIGALDSTITSAYNNLRRYPNDPLKDHASSVQSMYAIREFLKVFFSYYIPGIAYLVFLRFLPEILGLAKGGRNA